MVHLLVAASLASISLSLKPEVGKTMLEDSNDEFWGSFDDEEDSPSSSPPLKRKRDNSSESDDEVLRPAKKNKSVLGKETPPSFPIQATLNEKLASPQKSSLSSSSHPRDPENRSRSPSSRSRARQRSRSPRSSSRTHYRRHSPRRTDYKSRHSYRSRSRSRSPTYHSSRSSYRRR